MSSISSFSNWLTNHSSISSSFSRFPDYKRVFFIIMISVLSSWPNVHDFYVAYNSSPRTDVNKIPSPDPFLNHWQHLYGARMPLSFFYFCSEEVFQKKKNSTKVPTHHRINLEFFFQNILSKGSCRCQILLQPLGRLFSQTVFHVDRSRHQFSPVH